MTCCVSGGVKRINDTHVKFLRNGWAGREARPVARLFRLFGCDAEGDAPVQRYGIDLDVEAVAVGM